MTYEEFLSNYVPELQLIEILDKLQKDVISLEEMRDLLASASIDDQNV